jgi:hypothetical protein
MGFTPQVNEKVEGHLLFSILGRLINLEIEGFTISGRLIRFEKVEQAKHRPFVLILLLPDGQMAIAKWEGLIHWK